MKKIGAVIVALVLLGMISAGFSGWQYRQGEVDRFRQEADYYKQIAGYYEQMTLDRDEQLIKIAGEFASAEVELQDTRTKLQRSESELKRAEAKLANLEDIFQDTQTRLQRSESELKRAEAKLANFEDIFQLPWITEQRILRQFGVKVSGEVRDKPNSRGVKIGDYDLTPDELLIIFNVLSSLPPEIAASIHSITAVYQPDPGAGGYYNGGGNIIIIGTPDGEGNNTTARAAFISVLYHEIGHIVDFSILSSKEREEFYALYRQSQDEKDFADAYGKNNRWEDFATVFGSYLMDTEALLEKAEGSSLLMAKVEFIGRLFNQYYYKVEERGDIRRWRDGKEEVWPYRSRTNPEIETILFK